MPAQRLEGQGAIPRLQRLQMTEWTGWRVTMLLSAVFGAVEPVQLADWLLASGLQVRMQLQLHKHIWEPNARGV